MNIGRLSHQKNQLFLIRAFSQIASKNPDWILTLVGEGEKRIEIENLIRNLEIGEQVKLVGAVKNVDKWYKNAAFLAFLPFGKDSLMCLWKVFVTDYLQ